MGNILEQLKLMNEYLTNLDIQTTPKNILNMYNVTNKNASLFFARILTKLTVVLK